MLAASAMNGAIADTTYNFFFKLRFAKTYDTMLATPARPWDIAVGEILWSLIRGGTYSAMFFFVGATGADVDPATAPGNHSPEFLLDEKALDVGFRALLQVSLDYLHGTDG